MQKIIAVAVISLFVLGFFNGSVENDEHLQSMGQSIQTYKNGDDESNGGVTASYSSVYLENSSYGIKLRIYPDGAINEWTSPAGLRLTYQGFSDYSTSSVGIKIDSNFYICYSWSSYITTPLIKDDENHAHVGLTFPENINLVINYELVQNAAEFTFNIYNYDSTSHNVGLKWYYDTMVANNDGAPIYIPGEGVQNYEKTFYTPTFEYFSGYDHPIEPTLVSTGWISPSKGATLPDIVQLLDWSSGRNTWDCITDSNKVITGDSAVNLLWNPVTLSPQENRVITTFYGVGEPIAHGDFSIVDIYTDRPGGEYMPGEYSVVGVDCYAYGQTFDGYIRLEISNGTAYFDETKEVHIDANDITTTSFEFGIPSSIPLGTFLKAEAHLYNLSYGNVDNRTKNNIIEVNANYEFTVITDRPIYYVGEPIKTYATLTLNGAPVTGADVHGEFIRYNHRWIFSLYDSRQTRADIIHGDGIYSGTLLAPPFESGDVYPVDCEIKVWTTIESMSYETTTTFQEGGWPDGRLSVEIVEIQDCTEPTNDLVVGDSVSIHAKVKDPEQNPYTDADITGTIFLPNHTSEEIHFSYTGEDGIYESNYILPLVGSYIVEVDASSNEAEHRYIDAYDSKIISAYKGNLVFDLLSPETGSSFNKNEPVEIKLRTTYDDLIVPDAFSSASLYCNNQIISIVELNYIGDGTYQGGYIPEVEGEYDIKIYAGGGYNRETNQIFEDVFTVYPEPIELKGTIERLAEANKGLLDTFETRFNEYTEDGDYFYNKIIQDKFAIVLDILFGLISLGQSMDKIPKLRDLISKQFPGLPLIGNERLSDLQKSKSMGTIFRKALPLLGQADWQSRWNTVNPLSDNIIRGINNGYRNAFIKYTVESAIPEATGKGTEELIKTYLPEVINQKGGLSNTFESSFQTLIAGYKEGIEEDSQSALENMPNMPSEEENILIKDFGARWQGNTAINSLYYYSGDMLDITQAYREAADNDWIQKIAQFLFWFGVGILFNVVLDGPAWLVTLATVLAPMALNVGEDYGNLNEDEKMVAFANTLIPMGHQYAESIYSNTVSGLYYTLIPSEARYAEGKILSVREYSNGGYGWIPGHWVENYCNAFIEVKNVGDIPALYQVGAGIFTTDGYYTWCDGRTTSDNPYGVWLDPGETKTFEIRFKEHSDKIKSVKYYLFAYTGNGIYNPDLKETVIFSPTRAEQATLTSPNEQMLVSTTLNNETNTMEPIWAYPIRTTCSSPQNTLQYNVHICIENPAPFPISATINQMLPSNVEILNNFSGILSDNQIVWKLLLQPQETILLNFSLRPNADAGETIQIDGANMAFYDPEANQTLHLSSNEILLYVKSPIIADASSNTIIAGKRDNKININLTNFAEEEKTLTLNLEIQNIANESIQYSKSIDIAVEGNSTIDTIIDYNPNLPEGIYFLVLNYTYNTISDLIYFSLVDVDSDPPISHCELIGNETYNNWYSDEIEIHINSYDNISGVNRIYYRLNNADWITSNENISFSITNENKYALEFYATDMVGNQEKINRIYFGIDHTPPNTACETNPSVPNGNNNWFLGNVSIQLIGNDEISGLNSTKYKIDNGDLEEYNGIFVINEEGNHTVKYYSIDNASNEEETKTITIKIDKTKPTTTHSLSPSSTDGNNRWYISNVTITLNANDSVSGVNITKYKVDNGNWVEYIKPIKIINNGEHTIKYYSIDNAGNEEEMKTVTIKIDKTKPTVSIKTPDNGIYFFGKKIFSWFSIRIIGKITIEAAANDNISGIQKVEFYVDGNLKYTDNKSQYEWTYDEPAILFHRHAVKVKATDKAGNTKESDEIKVWVFNLCLQNSWVSV